MISAIVFDLDGVIADSRPVIESAWRTVAFQHGRDLTDDEFDRYVHGQVGADTVAALFPDYPEAGRLMIWAEVDRIEESAAYREIPGAVGFVSALHRAGLPIGLATSSWPRKVSNILDSLGLSDAFAAVATRDDVTRGKPHPDVYLSVCRMLATAPGNVLVFEDSANGVRSAVAAGTTCVGIGGQALMLEGAIACLPDFQGLRLNPARRDSHTLTGLEVPLSLSRTIPR